MAHRTSAACALLVHGSEAPSRVPVHPAQVRIQSTQQFVDGEVAERMGRQSGRPSAAISIGKRCGRPTLADGGQSCHIPKRYLVFPLETGEDT
jgi:hypothetical protein